MEEVNFNFKEYNEQISVKYSIVDGVIFGKVNNPESIDSATVFDSIVSRKNLKKLSEKSDNETGQRYIFGEIYQMFATNMEEVFCYLAHFCEENNCLNKLRLFDDFPSADQLQIIQEETRKEHSHVVFPLCYDEHFATGVCIEGNFYIFDSTRQLETRTLSNNKIGVCIEEQDFQLLNQDKKYQSELTGTCGFWTMLMCAAFAKNNINDMIKGNPNNYEIRNDKLGEIATNIQALTSQIFNSSNKQKINNAARDFNLQINFEKIKEDVKGTSQGIQPSEDTSKNLDNFSTIKKKTGLVSLDDDQCILQFCESCEKTNPLPSQPLIPLLPQKIQNIPKIIRNQAEAEIALLERNRQVQRSSSTFKHHQK